MNEIDEQRIWLTTREARRLAFLLFEAIAPAEEPGPHREDLAMDLGLWADALLQLIESAG
jgi:hypothetical protein